MTNPQVSDAIEAAVNAVMAEMPTDRGTTFEQAAQIYAQAAITAYLAALEASGWAVVPVEASEAQLIAGTDVMCDGGMHAFHGDAEKTYRAMIAARPRVEG